MLAKLSDRVTKEAIKLDSLKQYGRWLNLEIAGVPVTNGEGTNFTITEIAEILNVKITPRDISTSHRLQTKNKLKPHFVIVRFIGRDVRNKLHKNRKLAHNADFSNLSMKDENFTQQRKRLFWNMKQKAKQSGYKYCWTVNGNIYVRKSENTDHVFINVIKIWTK